MSADPLLRFDGDIHKGLEVVETKRGAVAPGTGLILERSGEGRGEERSILAWTLLDRRFDSAASQWVADCSDEI